MVVGVAVVGAGAWGTALAAHAARLGHDVRLWAHDPGVAEEIRVYGENRSYLAGVALPPGVSATASIETAVVGANLVVFAPPSTHLRGAARLAARYLGHQAYMLVATKGLEEDSLSFMSQVVAEVVPEATDRIGVLSGPSFAREVAAGLPADVVVAARSDRTAAIFAEALHAPSFRVYTTHDVVGVEVGGALKNVLAIAAGACDGLGLGANARAALITRGLAEMARLGVALGGDPLTSMGLSGMGDLILTSTGALSRNRALGAKLAEGVDPHAYLASQRTVAEGFSTSKAAWHLAQRHDVDVPITERVYRVLHEGQAIEEALATLMSRDQKRELLGLELSAAGRGLADAHAQRNGKLP